MFKQIKVRRISEEIFDQIKSAIMEGKLKPGEKLPTERELMQQLGVSRIPIREALKLLENIGLIDTRQGGGSYVRSLVTDSIRDPLNLLIKEDIENIFDLMEVRKEIEARSAYHAAQRADDSDIEDIARTIGEMKRYFDADKTPPNKLDADFHLAISRSSDNTVRSHLMFTIYNIFNEYFAFLIENICYNRDYYRQVYDQHRSIFNAIKGRKTTEAQERMAEHLTFVEGKLRTMVQEQKAKKQGDFQADIGNRKNVGGNRGRTSNNKAQSRTASKTSYGK
jgi:GntR family transcriptional regulator, transcriptional repressor for pyruvate dehydrogenase complex